MASEAPSTAPLPPLAPRVFPSSGFEVIDPSEKVEEEKLPFYVREEYYPMRIGEILQGRYQVVAKLGYGTMSTVWLSRDLITHKFWTLKVHIINTIEHNHELDVFRHLATRLDDKGKKHIRQLHSTFNLAGPCGKHDVFVMVPLGMSLRTFQGLQPGEICQKPLAARSIDQLVLGLDALRRAGVVHTDLHSDNLLIAMTDDSILEQVEQDEINTPSQRKIVDETLSIYTSRYMLSGAGPLTICDFGQARIGEIHHGPAMPLPYRAPEVLLDMDWEFRVDTWSLGLITWDLLEKKPLFRVYDRESPEQNVAHHLAAMVALLGPPPPEFLSRSEKSDLYWDEDGNWNGVVPIPVDRTLESLCGAFTGQERDWFLEFIRGLLNWVPERRYNKGMIYLHPWVRGDLGPLKAHLEKKKLQRQAAEATSEDRVC